ncbi:MAG: hypothetical protein ACKVX9_19980 [Blastocatellia bacterium]
MHQEILIRAPSDESASIQDEALLFGGYTCAAGICQLLVLAAGNRIGARPIAAHIDTREKTESEKITWAIEQALKN